MHKVLRAMSDRRLELADSGKAVAGRHKHWKRRRDGDIEWLLLDEPGRGVNVIEASMLEELDRILTDLEKDRPAGLVIRSSKDAGFIAGADIEQFAGMTDEAAVRADIERANSVLDRLEALKIPTIAVIHGHCLGGGLELALACRHRIATPDARLGFPEVLLGLHPGLGGTARSTFLIDPVEAMTMMLTGRTANARRARAIGLVDAVVEERHVLNAVRAAVAGRLKGHGGGLKAGAMRLGVARRYAAKQMRRKTAEQARKEHYPAPYALIDLWEEHGGDRAVMKRKETASFARLLLTPTSRNLVRVFFLRERLKKMAGDKADVRHVHVIGAGAMGADIAAWCAAEGLTATLTDLDAKVLGRAMKSAGALFTRRFRRRADQRDAHDRLVPDLGGEGVRHADVIIEAVPENPDIKKKVYAAVEPRMKEGAILATNTSSIRLEELSKGLARPDRFVGLHFFNPVARMELVEIVAHAKAGKAALDRARAFTGRISRLPAPVKSAPGFLVNRALMPYLLEAMVMLDEGVAKETVDEAARGFGMPMGPIELADRVGLDVCLAVAEVLGRDLKQPMPETPAWLRQKVEAGELGLKTGKGLYDYEDRKPKKAEDAARPTREQADRLILPILNTCVACLREGVMADEETIDGAMIFGTGFAPFRGGPLHYARERGADDIVARLEEFAGRHGPRFAPDKGWSKLKAKPAAARG